MGREEKAQERLNFAIHFYDRQGCTGKVAALRAALADKHYQSKRCGGLELSADLRHEIDEALRHASIYKENQEQQKRMNFLSAWQKMVEIAKRAGMNW